MSVEKKDRIISCGTCVHDCSLQPNADQCLYEGKPMKYYNWKRYKKNFNYSKWKPVHPENKHKLPDELFEVDI
jgi:hypothetical protein